MIKKFTLRGKDWDTIKAMDTKQFLALVPSRERRALKRGFTVAQKKLLTNIRANPKKFHRTKSRQLVIVPEMVGAKIGVHTGKEYVTVEVKQEMLGHRLGEFALTRKIVKHSAPGFGATRSSKYVPLK
ncbi:MAG: 30S ribosomal protein S19 [Candidatus Aenigmarchaeota archaeon]|nr:30S ribosomal protein S19 [Candidatus Aenigmarchaeota archaeon]